jgi:hypothetical protein
MTGLSNLIGWQLMAYLVQILSRLRPGPTAPAYHLSLARRRTHRYVAAGFPMLQEIAMVRTRLLGGAS